VESQIELVDIGGRRLVLESTRDITDRQRWEERQKLLLGELSHRVKNTLTVVQSMARQTLRTSASGEEFVERFEGRLAALANAHRLLVDSEWRGAELRVLARSQLEAHARRFRFEGPPVTLPPELATPFGLVLHELATNATKHGALSKEKGVVLISWSTQAGNEHPILKFEWRNGMVLP
jgi:two-component system, chemotaxis family, CheB/CheR fusion protein